MSSMRYDKALNASDTNLGDLFCCDSCITIVLSSSKDIILAFEVSIHQKAECQGWIFDTWFCLTFAFNLSFAFR